MSKLIVGLGNPGSKYEETKHNAGFIFLDYLAKSYGVSFKHNKKFNGEVAEYKINGEKIFLGKPDTYMNLSGSFVKSISDFYTIDTNDIIVIYDDFNFNVGCYRIRDKGSHGGHNGMKDIINKLKTSDIFRIKLGIGNTNGDVSNYVLSKFGKRDLATLRENFPKLKDACELIIDGHDLIGVNNKIS